MAPYSNGTDKVIVIDNSTKSQFRANYSAFSYSDLASSEQALAWLISAVDAVAMPILDHYYSFNFYYAWYTGFSNGNSYISPGTYNVSNLGFPERLENPNTGC
jgi:hypothetical protein